MWWNAKGRRPKQPDPHRLPPAPNGVYASHIVQDRWVAETFARKRDGYFLDFGAFDGTDMSNTLYLERELGWRGICVEPNPRYYPLLCASRTSVTFNAALWPTSRDVLRMVDAHGYSSLDVFKDADSNAARRSDATLRKFEVETINPTELLQRFSSPHVIDYLSLDVEGAEYDILTGLDLARYDVRLMTVEHDCNEERKLRVRNYLRSFGYVGVQMSYDDFFFKEAGDYPVSPLAVARALGCLE